MATSEELENGLLAELSYVNFRDISLSSNNEFGWKDNADYDILNSNERTILTDLLNTYKIVDFKSTASGMQALLLKDSSGNYTIAYRGTEMSLSWQGFLDVLVADVLGMGLKVAPKLQFTDALDVTSTWMDTYGLNSSNTTVSGHSLGGALAQLSSYTFGFEAYTYNAFGFDAATSGFRTTANAMYSIIEDTVYLTNAVKNTSNIYNFFAMGEDYQDFISGGLTELVDGFNDGHIGTAIPIKTYNGGLIGSHSSVILNDSIEIYNNIMAAGNITDYGYLTELFDSYSSAQVHDTQVIDVVRSMTILLGGDSYASVQDMAKSISTNFLGLKINSLVDKSSTELQSRNVENIYALLNSNHFTIEGNLPAYQDINPSDYSDMYMSDRADYMYYILDKENRYGNGSGKDSYKAFDSYGITNYLDIEIREVA